MRRFSMFAVAFGIFAIFTIALQLKAQDAPNGPPPQDGPGNQNAGPAGRNGPGGFHLIPRFAEQKLNLTDDQKTQIADLEKDTKDKLAKILTADQMKTLETARPPRPGQGGGPGGPGGDQQGPGGPGGN